MTSLDEVTLKQFVDAIMSASKGQTETERQLAFANARIVNLQERVETLTTVNEHLYKTNAEYIERYQQDQSKLSELERMNIRLVSITEEQGEKLKETLDLNNITSKILFDLLVEQVGYAKETLRHIDMIGKVGLLRDYIYKLDRVNRVPK